MKTKVTVTRIDPASTAKVISLTMGALVAIAILIHFVAVALGFKAAPALPPNFVGAGWVIATVPFIYMLGAYVVAWAFCLVLNFASSLCGGIRIEFSSE